MRTLAKLALAFAAAAVVTTAVVATLSAQPAGSGGGVRAKDDRFEVHVTEEMRRHSRINDTLYFVGAGYSLALLTLLLLSGISRRMRDAAERITRRPFLMAVLYIIFFTLVEALLEFPLTYYAGFKVPHQFDLSDQTFASWMGDQAKELAVGLLIGSLIGAGALAIIRRVKRWWLVLWLASIPLIITLIVVQPLVLDPLFNKFEPLQNQQLKQKLLDLASKAGIEGSRVYQVNKSKQTKTMNAYVNGIGPTKRIVMWDTLLAKMTEDEILAVMGHEMGHYVLKHIWKGLILSLLLSIAILWTAQRVHDRGLARYGARWGVRAPGDPASFPWLLLIVSVISFLLSPVTNGVSRYVEHQADVFSLEMTHLNEPMALAFKKFAEDSKVDPRPHPFIEFWRYSHPSGAKRIEFALHYKPWEHGQPNQLWKP
ncbi:MAG TPA: M48 family metallopeptidase [Thermoanaerobaculia bacterium]|jgi:Zn-dependent protease with chaperone function